MDFVRARRTLESLIAPVVDVLAAAGADPERLMLLGAVCRDVLHQAGGHDVQLRRTGDLDLAVAVDGQDAYTSLTAHLTQIPGSTSIRFSVAGQVLDLVPFGEIEHPDGHVPTPPDPAMNVLGFRDTFAAAHQVALPGGGTVRIPTIAGFTLLKLSAWASRSRDGEYRDGSDLACAMWWYQQDTKIRDRLYTEEAASSLLAQHGYIPDHAAVALLISDALAVLTPARQDALRRLWAPLAGSEDVLATYLSNTALPLWPRDGRLHDFASIVHAILIP